MVQFLMNLPKILVGMIFFLLGLYVLYKGVKNTRSKGIRDGIVDFIIGIGLVLLGLIIWSGFIN